MIYQCRLINCNKYTTMGRSVDNWEAYACMGSRGNGKSLCISQSVYIPLNIAVNLKLFKKIFEFKRILG